MSATPLAMTNHRLVAGSRTEPSMRSMLLVRGAGRRRVSRNSKPQFGRLLRIWSGVSRVNDTGTVTVIGSLTNGPARRSSVEKITAHAAAKAKKLIMKFMTEATDQRPIVRIPALLDALSLYDNSVSMFNKAVML